MSVLSLLPTHVTKDEEEEGAGVFFPFVFQEKDNRRNNRIQTSSNFGEIKGKSGLDFDTNIESVCVYTYYSVCGGFIVDGTWIR